MQGISIVVPTLLRADALRATLACLLHAATQAPFPAVEIVVVDDAAGRRAPCSSDAAPPPTVTEVLGSLGGPGTPSVRIVAGPGRGRAAARNAGASAARHGHLVFLDDDVLTGPGFLMAHAAWAGRDGFVHGPLREFPQARRWLAAQDGEPPGRLAQAAGRVLDGEARLLPNALERAVMALAQGALPDRLGWLACVGANVAVGADVFAAVGGFDEGFGTGCGCEDLELGARLVAAGHPARVEPAAAGVHLSHSRPGRWDQHDRNLARFVARHDEAAVRALPLLLGEAGGLAAYAKALGLALSGSAG